jgi:hypothetical protein
MSFEWKLSCVRVVQNIQVMVNKSHKFLITPLHDICVRFTLRLVFLQKYSSPFFTMIIEINHFDIIECTRHISSIHHMVSMPIIHNKNIHPWKAHFSFFFDILSELNCFGIIECKRHISSMQHMASMHIIHKKTISS